MPRLFVLLTLALILVGCSSVEEREPDPVSEIGLPEIAQRVGGELIYESETGKGVIEAERAQFVAVAGMDRVLFNGTEYLLDSPAVIIGGDLYIPRTFFARHLARGFSVAASQREVARILTAPRRAPLPIPKVEMPPAATGRSLAGKTIVIDAGHGGKDPGATHGGITEKQLNTAVSAMVVQALRAKGAKVVETRGSDAYVSLDQRVATSARVKAAMFVSIHANAFKRADVHGVEVYHQADRPTTPQSKALAASIIQHMVSRTGARNRGVREDVRGLRVLRKSPVPAVLVEMGYMTNPAELAKLADPGYQRAIADGIVAGIVGHAGVSGGAAE